MSRSILVCFILILCACAVNTSKEIDLEKLNFSYRDDAYLFFRNMRQTQYDLEIMQEGDWRIYRHADHPKDTSIFYFNVALVVNWRVNKAYPIIEMPAALQRDSFKANWVSFESEETGIIKLKGDKRVDELYFVSQLYNQLTKETELFVFYHNERIPLFKSPDEKEAFRVTLYDFYRLTGLL